MLRELEKLLKIWVTNFYSLSHQTMSCLTLSHSVDWSELFLFLPIAVCLDGGASPKREIGFSNKTLRHLFFSALVALHYCGLASVCAPLAQENGSWLSGQPATLLGCGASLSTLASLPTVGSWSLLPVKRLKCRGEMTERRPIHPRQLGVTGSRVSGRNHLKWLWLNWT